jgi:hypothetical protein
VVTLITTIWVLAIAICIMGCFCCILKRENQQRKNDMEMQFLSPHALNEANFYIEDAQMADSNEL